MRTCVKRKMSENDDEITLEIEDELLKCSKSQLVKYSDYFRVMFRGNFAESNKKIVLIKVRQETFLN